MAKKLPPSFLKNIKGMQEKAEKEEKDSKGKGSRGKTEMAAKKKKY